MVWCRAKTSLSKGNEHSDSSFTRSRHTLLLQNVLTCTESTHCTSRNEANSVFCGQETKSIHHTQTICKVENGLLSSSIRLLVLTMTPCLSPLHKLISCSHHFRVCSTTNNRKFLFSVKIFLNKNFESMQDEWLIFKNENSLASYPVPLN